MQILFCKNYKNIHFCFNQIFKGDNKPAPVKKAAAKPADDNKDNGVVIPVPPPPADKKQTDQQINAYKKQADDANQRAKAAEQRAASSESTVVSQSWPLWKLRGGGGGYTINMLLKDACKNFGREFWLQTSCCIWGTRIKWVLAHGN